MGLSFLRFTRLKNTIKKFNSTNIINLIKQKAKLDTLKNMHPIRSKAPQPSRPYRNLKPQNNMFDTRQKRIVNEKQKEQKHPTKEQEELQKAIKESQRTFNEQLKMKKQQKDNKNQNQLQNGKQDSDTVPLIPQRTYQVVPLQSVVNFFGFVNQRWLEAQRKAEIRIGVREEERLSNYIQIKYLFNREIFIDSDSIKGQRKAELQSIAEKLGAKIVTSPRNSAIVISTSWDNSAVQNAVTKFRGIKAVNQDYLIDCKKQNAQLDWREYSLKK